VIVTRNGRRGRCRDGRQELRVPVNVPAAVLSDVNGRAPARPDWLKLAHQKLDEAVFAAYGWSPTLTDEQLLENLLALNRQRAAEDDASR
jgi:hypothetical protein